jgi:hypothetical protein
MKKRRHLAFIVIVFTAVALLAGYSDSSGQSGPFRRVPAPDKGSPAPNKRPPALNTRPPAQAEYSIRVLCLYGSIPAKGFMGKEPMYGPNSIFNRTVRLRAGHVGVEYEPDKVLSFQPVNYDGIGHAGHFFSSSHAKNFNSCFRIYSERRMWNVLGNYYDNIDSLRRAVFVIPITAVQKHILDSLAHAYTVATPYDYAFLGMRCASASYDVLRIAGIVSECNHNIWYNVFTPQDFRWLLYKEYLRNTDKGWHLYTCKGSRSRKWDKDIDNWSKF